MTEAIKVTTTAANFDFEVVDTIFATDSSKAKLFSSADTDQAFSGVKSQLIAKCKKLGGDAVVDCKFEYRNPISTGMIKKRQVIEIFAYGTAVRRVTRK